jgi:hypothetical protein
MLNLIIATLISMGFNVNGEHFIMNEQNAKHIQSTVEYIEDGGDNQFFKFVQIDNSVLDDIVIVDDVDPDKVSQK